MKKLFSILLFLCVSMLAMAQDVIVKKDGSTILSKVLEVTSSEVKYKKFSNQDGPTYTIKVSELQAINYQNGEKDTFGDTTEGTHVETVTPQTTFNMNPQQQYNDAELLKMYKVGDVDLEKEINKGKRLRNIGLLGGGTLFVVGTVLFLINSNENHISGGWALLGGAGLIEGSILYIVGNNKVRKYSSLVSTSIYQQEFPLGNTTNLTADINVLSDNLTKQKTLGLGFHINF